MSVAFNSFSQRYAVTKVLKSEKGVSNICPIKFNDGLVFMSNKRSQIIKTIRDENGQLPYNLYYQQVEGKKAALTSALFSPELATDFNDGPVSFAKGGSVVYYSRNVDIDNVANTKKSRTLGIFSATKNADDTWSDPIPFAYNMSSYNVSHPAINEEGNILIFSSTMPGGIGQADLYMCIKKEDGQWSAPKNLGSSVNSIRNEMFPSFHNNEWLMFSSDGRNGVGGLDIFMTHWKESQSKYGVSRSLDADINSEEDDFGIAMNSDGLSGYFGSSRSGKDEIYHFEKIIPKLENCQEDVKINYCFLIQENNILEDDELPLKFKWDMGDGSVRYGLSVSYCYSDTGSYMATLSIIDTLSQEVYYEVSQVVIDVHVENRPYIEGPDTVLVSSPVLLETNLAGLSPKAVEIYWEFNNETIMAHKFDYTFEQLGTYEISMGVLDLDKNVKCVKRSIVVVDQATMNLFSTNGQEHKGPPGKNDSLGFAVELLNSIKKKALSDPMFDKVNYPVLERFDAVDSVYQYTVGETDKVASLYHLYKEMKQLGFTSKVVSFESNYNSNDLTEVLIFFAPGGDEISTYNEVNLKQFSKLLTNSSKLEILGYADPKGKAAFNKELSLKRANRVAKYLEYTGVPIQKMKISAFGALGVEGDVDGVLKYYRKVEVKLLNK
jgi:outer membrane protein OmpA-like peptidoglycan-associated protein